MEVIMGYRIKKLATITICLYTFVTTALYADNVEQSNSISPILFKANDILFHPAPGFPKGAQIVLIRGDLSKAEPYTIRFKLPDGFVIPSHWHSTDEELTVLTGTLNVGAGDKVDKSQSTALPAGSYQLVPAKVHHYVWTTGETMFQLNGMGPRTTTFVNPAEWIALIKASQ
jgi:quercetin dioxygenase-like cupin family protein